MNNSIDLSKFENSESDYNACVGNNGYLNSPNFIDYACGYFHAGDILLNGVINKNQDNWRVRDTLVYPILFNYRQGIELSLKHFLYNKKLLVLKNVNHKLEDILKEFLEMAPEIFAEMSIEELDKILNRIEIATYTLIKFDPGSITFRYPIDKKEIPTINKIEHINYIRIKEAFKSLSNDISRLDHDAIYPELGITEPGYSI